MYVTWACAHVHVHGKKELKHVHVTCIYMILTVIIWPKLTQSARSEPSLGWLQGDPLMSYSTRHNTYHSNITSTSHDNTQHGMIWIRYGWQNIASKYHLWYKLTLAYNWFRPVNMNMNITWHQYLPLHDISYTHHHQSTYHLHGRCIILMSIMLDAGSGSGTFVCMYVLSMHLYPLCVCIACLYVCLCVTNISPSLIAITPFNPWWLPCAVQLL